MGEKVGASDKHFSPLLRPALAGLEPLRKTFIRLRKKRIEKERKIKDNIKATTIGSLPFTAVKDAVKAVFKFTPEMPAWPQLTKRTFMENMYVQYSEMFPGIVINEYSKNIHVDTQRAYSEMEAFFEHFLIRDSEYFLISKENAAGFHEYYCELERRRDDPVIPKCQTVGPVTFGLSIKDEKGQAIFYNEQLKEIVIKNILMKSIWQINKLLKIKPFEEVILFIDEPYLAAYGSAFASISKEDIVGSIKEITVSLKEYFQSVKIKIGVHCCANTDWSLLLDTGIDILSFDAYEFFESLLLYKDKLKEFIDNNHILAWGIVPTKQESIENETIESLFSSLSGAIGMLVSKGIDKTKLLNNVILTPSCGLGNCSDENALKSLNLLYGLTNLCREKL